MIKTAFLIFIISANCFAAGGGHGSVADLIAPIVNFVLLATLFTWKFKGSIVGAFNNWSTEVEEKFNSAKRKSQEAQMKMDVVKKKVANLDSEKKKIQEESKKQLNEFAAKNRKEAEERSQKIKDDAVLKVNAEKNLAYQTLYGELVDNVIIKAKESIQANPENKKKVSKSLLSRI